MESVRRTLFARYEDCGENVYAVLDGAAIDNLMVRLSSLNQDSLCLFRGNLDPALEAVSPHLVRIEPQSPFTDFVLSGWGRHWGIFVLAEAEPAIMQRHFRRMQIVDGPDGNPALFRYYDPRVLADFLPTCTRAECEQVLGPVTKFVMEGDEADEIIHFTLAAEGANRQAYNLTDGRRLQPEEF